MLDKKEQKTELISDKSVELLNYRINEEEVASRQYCAIALWMQYNGYKGLATYWRKWSQEELVHASWAREYLLDLNVKPKIQSIREVKIDFKDIQDALDTTLEAEKDITEQCHKLAQHAAEEKDFMLMRLAQKYLLEQQEEMAKIMRVITAFSNYGTEGGGLYEFNEMLEKEVNNED